MFLRFDFEEDLYATLSCVPLAVRRKLDLAGLKISLAGWQALPRAERLALCHLPVETPEDLEVYREILRAFAARADVVLKELPELTAAAWTPFAIPERVAARAAELGRPLDAATWGALGEEARYCLWKYASTKDDVAKVAALFAETLDRTPPPP